MEKENNGVVKVWLVGWLVVESVSSIETIANRVLTLIDLTGRSHQATIDLRAPRSLDANPVGP